MDVFVILASSLEYPQRIEWSQCLKRLILGCLQIFSFFPLSSSSFYTVQYRRVQYSTVIYWPATPSIHRGLEWPQLLKRLFSAWLLVCLEANFLIFLLLTSSFIDCLLFYFTTHSVYPNYIKKYLRWQQLIF